MLRPATSMHLAAALGGCGHGVVADGGYVVVFCGMTSAVMV
jgi:hypothetical protein